MPATPAQLEVWLAGQREPESGRYNINVDLEFTPGVDVPALRAALRDVLAAHPALRSRFDTDNGGLTRVVEPAPPVAFVEHREPGPFDRAQALRWAAVSGKAVFDLAVAPLLRAALLVKDDGALFSVTMHHIISDGWSTNVFTQDLITAYRARTRGETGLSVRSSAEEPEFYPELAEAAEQHWSTVLRDAPAPLAPLHDLVAEDGLPGPSADVELALPAGVMADVQALAQKVRGSSSVVLLGAWSVLLHAWSGRSDGTFGMVFSGREYGAEDEIDLRSRVLPMRDRLDADRSFQDVLAGLRDQLLDALEHSSVPAQLLQQIRRESTERTVFMYTPAYEGEWRVGDTTVRRFDHPDDTTKYEFSINAIEGAEGIRLCLYYDSSRYREATARLFVEQLRELITSAVAEPHRSCGDLLSVCDTGLAQLQSHGAPVAPTADLVPDLVLRHAAERPDSIAVRHGEHVLTYRELVEQASAVANWLRDNGTRPGETVALLLPPGADTPVFWLGCVLAGAAYLPLDPAYPQAQLQLIVDDARPPVLVVDPGCEVDVKQPQGIVVTVTDLYAQAPAGPAPVVERDGGSTFCVLYTSGTTGRPKGVVLPHRGMARLMERPDFIPLDPSDVIAQLCPLNFDGATYEIWGALAHGAELVVLDKHLVLSPREMRTVVRERGITTLLVTTPLLNRIIEDAPDLLQSLRRVYFGGEIISVAHMRRALRWCGPNVLLHSYGPTENSFTSTWFAINEVDPNARTLPMGRPVPGTEARVVLEGTTTPVPRGVAGELLLGGVGLADGYLNDPELTASRFVTADARLYRTGDRVRWNADGLLEFIGRNDNQVKIRSQRVELGEVEAVLDGHSAVTSVFVTVHRNPREEKEIVAYVVATRAVDPAELRQYAQTRLPGFAVPRHIVVVDALPLTPTGKIDRRRLPVPDLGAAPVVRTTGVLDQVRSAWKRVLDHDITDLDLNFFDAGGHSLLLVRLQDELRAATGTEPSIMDLMRHVTVRAQANLLGGEAQSATVYAEAPQQRTVKVSAAVAAPQDERRHHVLALSARSTDALSVAREQLAATRGVRLEDVARTLDGRERFEHRFAVVTDDLASAALTVGEGTVTRSESVVFAFGDCVAPLGDSYRLFPKIRELAEGRTGAELAYALQVGIAEQFIEWGVSPAAVCGTGSGRLAAATVSGALSFSDGLRGATALGVPKLRWITTEQDGLSDTAGLADLAKVACHELGPTVLLDIGTAPSPEITVADAVVVPTLTPGVADDRALMTAVAALWCRGVDVALSTGGRRVHLPGHPLSWATTKSTEAQHARTTR
ncbi:amino acid adenylation domain-containing protein [Allokutzneria sp. A3M-2-11 16]|uniref:non-ribosomal peptide synthetase n=1 Tax=Allokutzneria sp. A3M-2-11 16 TaxID=2962043 RepID=UPI0020B6988A|nr:amino acid adenylation domain-containing protein [Allokutzneria sp. A3M-2-11 16]MCP3803429.1 amino acid adenylation domain-containing protein [Allokutzneria sp. A3M-2-11 16]